MYVEDESQGELCREQNATVEAETIETNVGTVEEKINDAKDSIGDNEGDLSEKHCGKIEENNSGRKNKRQHYV